MVTHRLVLTEDLNQYGFLFGGRLLSWADEAGFIAASQGHPSARFVTIGMSKVEFRHSVKNGSILKIATKQVRRGNSSVTYGLDIYLCGESRELEDAERGSIFCTEITYVNVGEDGKKQKLV